MSQAGRYSNGTGGSPVETLTGNSGGPVGPDGAGNINILGSGTVDVAGNPGTNTLTISVSGAVADEFPTDSGTAIPVGGVLNIFSGPTAPNLISNINTSGSGNTVRVALNNTIEWPLNDGTGTRGVLYLNSNRFLHSSGVPNNGSNTFVGANSGNFTVTSTQNTGVGLRALQSLTSSASNTSAGTDSLAALTSGNGGNCGFGTNSGTLITTGAINDLFGTNTGFFGVGSGLKTGSANILIGSGVSATGVGAAGSFYNGAESSNILIRNVGVLGENNTIRIGTAGAALGQQNRCFIAGISGIATVGASAVTYIDNTGKLGTVAGGPITMNTGANSLTISGDASATTITLGAGAASKSVTVGSTNTTSSTTVQSGSGALNVTSTNGALTINSGTGALNISNDASATTVNIGSGAAAKTVQLGSTNTTSSLALRYGTSDFTLASATGTVMNALDTGEITYPLQPAFLAYNSANDANQTGAGATATVDFDTEVFDQNGDFAADTFTAPVTGRYHLETVVDMGDLTAAMTTQNTNIVTSNRTYQVVSINSGAVRTAVNTFGSGASVLADMDIGDTAIVQVVIANGAGNTATIRGSATLQTYFSGQLAV